MKYYRERFRVINRESDSSILSEQLLGLLVRDIIDQLRKRWGIRDPVDVLRECIKNREWFKGVVLSTAFLEGVGIQVLSFHFKHQIKPKKILHLGLDQIIMLLYALQIINQSTYSKMIEVRDFRNGLVHLNEPSC